MKKKEKMKNIIPIIISALAGFIITATLYLIGINALSSATMGIIGGAFTGALALELTE